MLPNFICPGTQKAATTTLYHLLRQHPRVYIPEIKEVHFFDADEHEYKGLPWYEQQFTKAKASHKVIGDITPSYMYLDFVPERIYRALGPNVKFLFMLRDPVEQAFSHYCMSVRLGNEQESFEQALALEQTRIQGGVRQRRRHSYINRGFYSRQIKRFMEYYPYENLFFVIFEDFIQRTPEIMREIFNFLVIDQNIRLKTKIWENKTKQKDTNLSPTFKQTLGQLFTAEIEELESLIKRDLSHWRY